MTERQARYLRRLCKGAERPMPRADLSKREAHELIKGLSGGSWLTNVEVRDAVECPHCGVGSGSMCRRASGTTRLNNHARRVTAARVLLRPAELGRKPPRRAAS